MRSWCLCQICTCGRHHCPHGTTRIYENSGTSCPTTEYLEKYPTYGNVPPPQSLKPKQEFRACRGKMEGITTFKSDYRPYEIVKQPRQVPEEYKPKQGEIDLGTTYKRDFNSYKAQPVAIVRPLERQQAKQGKLDTVPTYKGFQKLSTIRLRCSIPFLRIQVSLEVESYMYQSGMIEEAGEHEEETNQGNLSNFILDY
uniref:Stabilizer of axonemal microtubules 2 n=1 Tax=Felis catus TaxID=9685 RepID=A0ABI7XT83_FELCA